MPGDITNSRSSTNANAPVTSSTDVPPTRDFVQAYKLGWRRELFLEKDEQIRAAAYRQGIRISEVPGGVVHRVGTMV